MRIFSVLPRPVSSLVNPPPGVYPQPRRSPQNARNAAGVTSTHTSKKNAVERSQNAHSAHQPKPHQHSTNRSTDTEPGRLFKITLYSNPGEVAAHRVAPTETHRQPHREPERRRGVMGVAPQTEATHSGAQAAQRATENAPSRSPERCALFIHFQQVSEDHERKNQNAK